MALSIVKAIPLLAFDSATLTAIYQPINPNGLPQACFTLRIINGSNTSVVISYDGSTDNDILAAGQTLQIPTPINTVPNSRGALFAKGNIVYVKQTVAPGVGAISLVGYYQPQY